VAERFGRKWRKTTCFSYFEGAGAGERKRAWEELDGEMEEWEPPLLSELLMVWTSR